MAASLSSLIDSLFGDDALHQSLDDDDSTSCTPDRVDGTAMSSGVSSSDLSDALSTMQIPTDEAPAPSYAVSESKRRRVGDTTMMLEHKTVSNISIGDLCGRLTAIGGRRTAESVDATDTITFVDGAQWASSSSPDLPPPPMEARITLRSYQSEMAHEACLGRNVVLTAPTGSGKTFVAGEVIRLHLLAKVRSAVVAHDKQPTMDANLRVIFVVPRADLLEQQRNALLEYLPDGYNVVKIDGPTVARVMRTADVLVCTPQIVLNALEAKEENNRWSLDDISLIILDECHNATGRSCYMQLTQCVLRHYKQNGVTFAEGWADGRLKPQMMSMTASLGTGRSDKMDKTITHITKSCASLLSPRLVSVQRNVEELNKHVVEPITEHFNVLDATRRSHLYKSLLRVMEGATKIVAFIMEKHEKAFEAVKSPPDADFKMVVPYDYTAWQPHEQWYSRMRSELLPKMHLIGDRRGDKEAVRDALDAIKLCAVHIELLKHTNSTLTRERLRLQIQQNYSSIDAGNSELQKALHRQFAAITSAEDMFSAATDGLLDRLVATLQRQYCVGGTTTEEEHGRTLVFVRTREIAETIAHFIDRHPHIGGINARSFTGVNSGTSNETANRATLTAFGSGDCRVLVATTVAEEGLDITTCNAVIHYNHVTNDIASVQRKGRGRAVGSRSITLSLTQTVGTKDSVNESREALVLRAIAKIHMDDQSFAHDVTATVRQTALALPSKAASSAVSHSNKTNNKQIFDVVCIKCDALLCRSDEIYRRGESQLFVGASSVWCRVVRDTRDAHIPLDKRLLGHMFQGKMLCGSGADAERLSPENARNADCLNEVGVTAEFDKAHWVMLKPTAILLHDGRTGERHVAKKWKDFLGKHLSPGSYDGASAEGRRLACKMNAVQAPVTRAQYETQRGVEEGERETMLRRQAGEKNLSDAHHHVPPASTAKSVNLFTRPLAPP